MSRTMVRASSAEGRACASPGRPRTRAADVCEGRQHRRRRGAAGSARRGGRHRRGLGGRRPGRLCEGVAESREVQRGPPVAWRGMLRRRERRVGARRRTGSWPRILVVTSVGMPSPSTPVSPAGIRRDGEEVERADRQAPVEPGFGCRFIDMVGLGFPLASEFHRLVLGNDVGADQAPFTDLQILEVDHR